MSPLRHVTLEQLIIEDERSFRHVGLYRPLKAGLVANNARFIITDGGVGRAQLLNLAFWRPDGTAEVLVDETLTADQLMHNAWHVVIHHALGDDATTADGLLLAESVASAFDVYLIGRLIGHAPDSSFLLSQVPPMSDSAEEAGLEADQFEALLQQMATEPEASFEQLRQLLFDASTRLLSAQSIDDAADTVAAVVASNPFGALLHHYELPSWVLYARAYASSLKPCESVRLIDQQLRVAADSLAWLERNVVSGDAA